MTRSKRILIVVISVIVGLVIAASVALRLVLTGDRLQAFIVPRVEKTVDAKISVGDVGVRFPFGFGVDIRDLAFEKALPGGNSLSFTSNRVLLRASLLSLIRRRPEIKAVEVKGGRMKVLGARNGADVSLCGLESRFSMKPGRYGYSIRSVLAIDSVSFAKEGKSKAVTLENITFEGTMEIDTDFDSLRLHDAELRWDDLITVRLSGEVAGLKTERKISLDIESADNPMAPLVDRLMTLPLGEMVPALKGGCTGKKHPVRLTGGAFSLVSRVKGNGRRFSDMDISGKLGLKDLTIVHEAVGTPFNVNGELHFSQGGAEAKALSVVLGQSTAEIGFKISAAGDRSVESVSFSGDLGLDLGDLFSNLKVNDLSIRGKLKARIEGSGRPALLTGLFPSGERRLSPEEITSAWRQVTLEGRVDVDGVALSMKGNPVHVSSLRAGADIARGSVDNVRAEFCLNGSPFRCSASFKRVMPAVAGLAMMIGDDRSGRSPRTLRKVLDSIEIVPDISFDLSGRSLDTRVLGMPLAGEESRKGQAGAGRTGRRKGAAGGEAAPSFAENPLTLLLLKNSTFKARLDSVITPKAVLTDIEAVGTIRSGRARIDPLSLRYAGGKGTGNLGIDLRNPDRVRTKANLSFEEIDAGRALASLHGLGSLVEGRFAFESKGELVSGPGLNPLVTLGAAGSASSSKGRVSISHFISPLSGEIGLDLSRFERFDFDEWSGSFLIDKGRFITDDWKIRSRKGDWSIRGFFGLDGTLDYAVRLLIPPAQQKEMKDLKKYRDLVELLKDRNGNLVLDFHIGGTASSPKLSIDLSGAKERAGEKLIDGLKKKAKDWLKK